MVPRTTKGSQVKLPRRVQFRRYLAEATGCALASPIDQPGRVPTRIRWPDLRSQHDHGLLGSGRRNRSRMHKLNPAEESAIRELAATRSLRSLAATFGVSHQTISRVLWRKPT